MISIVDDDVWAREGIREFVQSLGYRAITFDSAEQFLNSGFVESTTCLITDLHMSGLSGLDLQRRLQAQGHRTPIIFVTAYPDKQHQSRALDAGAVGFLSKPLDEQTLIDCLALAVSTANRQDGGLAG